MTTERARAAGALGAHRRTAAAAALLGVAAVAAAVSAARPAFTASGTVVIAPNPVYVAAEPARVAPRALAAGRGVVVPEGAAVAVEPAEGTAVRITATASDGRTARALANTVLTAGLPAALRAQVADGLLLRKQARGDTGTTVAGSEVDAAMRSYGLRVVAVSRALGTTPLGGPGKATAGVQAVAVAQVAGLPAGALQPAEAGRLVASAMRDGAFATSVVARRPASLQVSPGGDGAAVTVTATARSAPLAEQVARDAMSQARTPMARLLRSAGLPSESLVVEPYVTPSPIRSGSLVPWWLGALVGLGTALVGIAAIVDRRDRAGARSGRAGVRSGRAGVRNVRSGRRSARRGLPAVPPARPRVVEVGPVEVPATGVTAASGADQADRPSDWTPVLIAEWRGSAADVADADPAAGTGLRGGWGAPRPFPPEPVVDVPGPVDAGPVDAGPVDVDLPDAAAGWSGSGYHASPALAERLADRLTGPHAVDTVDLRVDPPLARPAARSAAQPAVVDLRSQIFGAGVVDGDGGASGGAPAGAGGPGPAQEDAPTLAPARTADRPHRPRTPPGPRGRPQPSTARRHEPAGGTRQVMVSTVAAAAGAGGDSAPSAPWVPPGATPPGIGVTTPVGAHSPWPPPLSAGSVAVAPTPAPVAAPLPARTGAPVAAPRAAHLAGDAAALLAAHRVDAAAAPTAHEGAGPNREPVAPGTGDSPAWDDILAGAQPRRTPPTPRFRGPGRR